MNSPNEVYHNLQGERNVIPHTIAATATLLVYDLICTVDQEVGLTFVAVHDLGSFHQGQMEYVWTAPYSIGTIMFVLNRYLPLIDTFISLHLLTSQSTPETCVRGFKVVTWFIMLGSVLAEGTQTVDINNSLGSLCSHFRPCNHYNLIGTEDPSIWTPHYFGRGRMYSAAR